MRNLNTVLVTGYARAPQGTSMYEVYKHAGIVLEINYFNHTIEKVDFTFIADLTSEFFKKLLEGYDLQEGLDPLIEKIKKHYFAPSQQAMIVALQSAVQRYWDYVKEQ
ncbi:DUF3870 domain-containing protein [Salipaludibacillus daqingensis]|uniref:DUF3870 domain-containing protein n=1 Tax=Salipaludibacillus daqingensis TaxID=3041001 RepID=UPI0024766A6B|nr:DUF3870 domain-containing protein [Salipaludibacillus daqingensis]